MFLDNPQIFPVLTDDPW